MIAERLVSQQQSALQPKPLDGIRMCVKLLRVHLVRHYYYYLSVRGKKCGRTTTEEEKIARAARPRGRRRRTTSRTMGDNDGLDDKHGGKIVGGAARACRAGRRGARCRRFDVEQGSSDCIRVAGVARTRAAGRDHRMAAAATIQRQNYYSTASKGCSGAQSRASTVCEES